VVHDFATKYFALPPRHTTVIADAVSYASETAQSDQKFDYIIHDVFTGGAEPVDLFTIEFLQNLHAMLKNNGVIAINYAGDLLLPPPRIIANTIKAVFPNCRIYRESEPPSETVLLKDRRDFTNMVFFCINSGAKVTFRKAKDSDFLQSGARRHYLMPEHEIKPEVLQEKAGDGGVLYKNQTERFTGWQQKSAAGHWAVMRTVLPKEVWENW